MTDRSTCYTGPMTTAPAPRADAARNRELLLAAAEAEFAERGDEASAASIARRAGVAKGTVFRHFATMDELIAAIVAKRLAHLTALAREQLDSDDPAAGLYRFLIVAADQRTQLDLRFLMSVSNDCTAACVRDELHGEVVRLVDRAQASGALRADITGTDVFLLMCSPLHAVENLPGPPRPNLWRRYLDLIFDGLRPQGAHPLSEPAPDWGTDRTPGS